MCLNNRENAKRPLARCRIIQCPETVLDNSTSKVHASKSENRGNSINVTKWYARIADGCGLWCGSSKARPENSNAHTQTGPVARKNGHWSRNAAQAAVLLFRAFLPSVRVFCIRGRALNSVAVNERFHLIFPINDTCHTYTYNTVTSILHLDALQYYELSAKHHHVYYT